MKKAFETAGKHQDGTHITTMERDLLIEHLLTPYKNMEPATFEKKCPFLIKALITDFSMSGEQEEQLVTLMKKILSLPQVVSAQPSERIRLYTVLLEEIIHFPISSEVPISEETLMALVPVFENFIRQVASQPGELQELEQALRQALRKIRVLQVVSEIIAPFTNHSLSELTKNLSELVNIVNSYQESGLLRHERSFFLSKFIEKIYGCQGIIFAAANERIAFFSMLMRTMVAMNIVSTPDTEGQRLLSSSQAPQKELTEFLKAVAAGVNVPFSDAARELNQAIRINTIRQRVKNQLLPLQGKTIPQLLTILPGLMQAINAATTSQTLPAEEGKAFIAAIIASLSSFQHVSTGPPEDRIRLFSSLAGAIVHLNLAREPAALKQLLSPFGELIERETALNAVSGRTLHQEIVNKFDDIIIYSLTACQAMTPAMLARNFPTLIKHLHAAAKTLKIKEKNRFLFVVMKTITAFPGIAASPSGEKIKLFSTLMETLIPILTVTDTGLQNSTVAAENQQVWLLFFDEMIEKIAPEQVAATQELRLEFEQALRQVRIRQSVVQILAPYRNLTVSDLKTQLPAFITSLNAYDASLLSLEERRVLLTSIFKTLISLSDADEYFWSDKATLFSALMEEIPRLTLMTSPDTAGQRLVAVAADPQELTAFFNHLSEGIAPEVGPVWKRALREALRQTGIRKAIRQALQPFREQLSAGQKPFIPALMENINALSIHPDRPDNRVFFTLVAEEITLFIKEMAGLSLPALGINDVDEAGQFTMALMEQMEQLNVVVSLQEQGQAMMRTLQDNVEKFMAPRRRYAVDNIIILQLYNTNREDNAVLREVSRLQQAYPHAITVRYDVINKVPEVIKGSAPLPPGEITLLAVAPAYQGTQITRSRHNEQAGTGQQQLRMAFTALKNSRFNVLSRGSTVHPLLIEVQADTFRVIPTSIQSWVLDTQYKGTGTSLPVVTPPSVSEPAADSQKEKPAKTTGERFTLTHLREGESYPAVTRVVLSSTPEKALTLIPASRQAATKQSHHAVQHSHYPWTVIIHTGSDPAVLASLQTLAAKEGGKNILIQYDPKDVLSFKVQTGHDNLRQIAAHHRVRYILAGHGDAIANTFDGRNPQQTYSLYQQTRQQFQLPPGERLVLLACELGNDGSRPGFKDSFALNFAHLATKDTPISPSVRAYSRPVFINEAGKRLPADITDPDSDTLQDYRVEYRNHNQVMEVNGIPAPLIDILQERQTGTETSTAIPVLTETHQRLLQQYFPGSDGGIDQVTLAAAMQSLPSLRKTVLQIKSSVLLTTLAQEQWSALSQLSTQLWDGHLHPQKLNTIQQKLLHRVMEKGLLYASAPEELAMAFAVRNDAGRLIRHFFQLQTLFPAMQTDFSSSASAGGNAPSLSPDITTAVKKITGNSNRPAPVIPVSQSPFTRGFLTTLSRTLQILGVLSAIKEILIRPFRHGLTPGQEALLETQHNLLMATLATNIGNETAQQLLAFTGRQIQTFNLQMPSLIKQITPLSAQAGRFLTALSLLYADSITGTSLKGLRVLTRGMNRLFPVLGAGFSIHEVLHTAMALTEETDAQKRMDLHTRFALSLAGTAALFTGSAALPLSMLLLLAGLGYTAFRHYEDVNRYLTLKPAEALMVLFSPLGILPNGLKIPFEANRARAELSRLQQEQAHRLLEEKNLDAIYFSPGKVKSGRQLSEKETQAIYHTVQDSWFARLILAAARFFSTLTTSPLVQDSRDDIDLNKDQFISDGTRLSSEKMRLLRTGRRKLAEAIQGSQPDQQLLLLDVRGNKTEQLASFDGIFMRLLDDEGKVKQRIAAPTGKLPRWVLSGNLSGDNREEILLLSPQKETMTVLTFFTGRESPSRWGFSVHSEGGDYLRRPGTPGIFSRQKNYYGLGTKHTDALTADPLLADIDGDGFDDLLLMHAEGISICYGDWGEQQETQWSFFAFYNTALAGKAPRHVLSGRQNKDNRADLVIITDDGAVHTLLGNQDRRKKFTLLPATPDIVNAESMQQKNVATLLHDLDEDGRADLVIIQDDYQGTRAMVAHGQAEGKFGPFLPDAFSVWRDSGWLGLAQHRIIGFKKNSTTLVSMDGSNAVYEHIFTRYRVAEVMLGSDDDTFRASEKTSDWRYIIRVAESGKQRYEAGTRDDIFWLQRPVRDNNGSLLDGREGQDTLIIAGGSHDGNRIILPGRKGSAGQISAKETREQPYSAAENNRHSRFSQGSLSLLNIEHVQGHKDSRDDITGNEENNWLSGIHSNDYDHRLRMQPEKGKTCCECQEDYLDGGEGYNELTLSRGTAANGAVYQIVQCEHETDTEVALKTASSGEISQVFLGYRAEQMQRPERAGNDLLIRLQHNKGTCKRLRLSNLYKNRAHLQDTENTVTTQGGFVLHTSDGISLAFPRLSHSEILPDGHPVNVTWDARYHRNWSELTADQPAQHIEVLQQKKDPVENRGKIKIYGHGFAHRTVTLADFMQLVLTDTPYSNRHQGDSQADRLCAFWMKGGNGEDSYHWDGRTQETIIDNDATDGIADVLVLPWQAEKSRLKRQGNNLILSEQAADGRRFLILNFFAAAEYRHLNVRDASDNLCVLNADNEQALLASWPLQHAVDARIGNRRALYATTGPLTLDMRTATDWVLTEDHSTYAHRWYGSNHDDVHVFREQNKTLYDTRGNEIYLFAAGSRGNFISDSTGDDRYRIDASSGHNIIADNSGHDTLELIGVNETELQQKRHGDDHVVTWSATGSLKIQNYYLNDSNRLESILLMEAITGMPATDVQMSIHAGPTPLSATRPDKAVLPAAMQTFHG